MKFDRWTIKGAFFVNFELFFEPEFFLNCNAEGIFGGDVQPQRPLSNRQPPTVEQSVVAGKWRLLKVFDQLLTLSGNFSKAIII